MSKELKSSLEAHNQRMWERNVDKAKANIYLLVPFVKKQDQKVNEKWYMNKGRGNYQNNGRRDFQNSNNSTFQMGEYNCNRGGGQAIINVATIEEKEEEQKMIRGMYNVIIIKSLTFCSWV